MILLGSQLIVYIGGAERTIFQFSESCVIFVPKKPDSVCWEMEHCLIDIGCLKKS